MVDLMVDLAASAPADGMSGLAMVAAGVAPGRTPVRPGAERLTAAQQSRNERKETETFHW
jgi:hypothetical protein